ncbi:amidohydrolase family protein [Acuticoccus sp. M5D2P5]|uniref:metal-dependent hydrolase family protein n=1 Tax=Acuticoccus kalidii TaxID=2910977 RepID=UPI001F47C407|nr:amidohydrolase family protein [Acuticoccus kalidii]MCF3932107.1 amidohydrolase family protein [Acuticoccus kalidii]
MIAVLENANVVDVDAATVLPDRHVVIENGVIREISPSPVRLDEAERTDLAGRYVIPGLIDCHVHATAYSANLSEQPRQSPMYVAARSQEVLRGMLKRGFTTVRDEGGAEFGLALAVEEGWFTGPRILYCGKALSPTGGHGDLRPMGVDTQDESYALVSLGRICNGVDAVREAARDEIRRGAHHIKIMANGGISSPTDRITSDQFSEAEIAAAVDEAEMAGLYVTSHTYTARSVARCVRNGVRSIEHGNLLDEETVALMKEHGAYLVPTLSCFRALSEVGEASGFPPGRMDKIRQVLDGGIKAVEMAYRAGVPMAYGTDLLGPMHGYQLDEFALRADVVPPADLLRSATSNAADLVFRKDIGRIVEGAQADLAVLDANPLDAGVLPAFADHLRAVYKGGIAVA